MENKTIPEIIEEIKEQICDKYCKYPGEYKDPDELIEKECENCPLCRL